MSATGKQDPRQDWGISPQQGHQWQKEIRALFSEHGYLSKSFRFFGEGHSSWKLADAHTLAWLSTRYFRWECTCRAMRGVRELPRDS